MTAAAAATATMARQPPRFSYLLPFPRVAGTHTHVKGTMFRWSKASCTVVDIEAARQARKYCMCPPDVEWRAHDSKSHNRRRRSGPEGCRTSINNH